MNSLILAKNINIGPDALPYTPGRCRTEILPVELDEYGLQK